MRRRVDLTAWSHFWIIVDLSQQYWLWWVNFVGTELPTYRGDGNETCIVVFIESRLGEAVTYFALSAPNTLPTEWMIELKDGTQRRVVVPVNRLWGISIYLKSSELLHGIMLLFMPRSTCLAVEEPAADHLIIDTTHGWVDGGVCRGSRDRTSLLLGWWLLG